MLKSAMLFAAGAAVFSMPLAATTVDPDAFADGTDISNAFAGVTLASVFTGADINTITAIGSVYSLTDPNATTGSRAFGHSVNNTTWGNGAFEYLLATFDSTVTSVSLDFFANDAMDGNPQLLAFDAMGNQIAISNGPVVALGAPITLTVNGAGIKSVRAYWDEINRVENGGLDNLVFDAVAVVPEPATWAMLIAGFGAMGGAMRRRALRPRFA